MYRFQFLGVVLGELLNPKGVWEKGVKVLLWDNVEEAIIECEPVFLSSFAVVAEGAINATRNS